MNLPVNNKYEPIGIKEIVTRPKGGYVAYNKESISIEPKTIAIPMAEISRNFCVKPFETMAPAARKARLKNKAPICLVALKNKTLVIAKNTGEEITRGLNIFTIYPSNGNKK